MKVILGLMCGLVVLFGGSCVVLAGTQMGSFGIMILAVVLLNALVLIALFGWAKMPAWPLYVLAAVDFVLSGIWLYFNMPNNISNSNGYHQSLGLILFVNLPALIFATKGFLTIRVARKMNPTI